MNSSQISTRVESIVRDVIDEMLIESPSISNSSDHRIPIGISARHLHITQEHLEHLFGKGTQLTRLKDLVEPGEFAANETVAIVGPNRRIFSKVRILGPVRSITQVELSFTDGVYLGMDLPHRLSGDIQGSAPVTIIGPQDVLRLPEGAIRAIRHIHMNPEDAERFEVSNGDKVNVQTEGPASVTFNNTVIRVKEGLYLQMHVDTDEANAAGLDESNSYGVIL